jgi:hypothetical protein
MFRYQSHAQRFADHEHKAVAATKKLGEVFGVPFKWKLFAVYKTFVERGSDQRIEMAFFQFFAGTLQGNEGRFSSLFRCLAGINFNIVFPAIDHVDAFVSELSFGFYLCVIEFFNIQQLLVKADHTRRTVNNRSYDTQQAGVGQSFDHYFGADAIEVTEGYTNSGFLLAHIFDSSRINKK